MVMKPDISRLRDVLRQSDVFDETWRQFTDVLVHQNLMFLMRHQDIFWPCFWRRHLDIYGEIQDIFQMCLLKQKTDIFGETSGRLPAWFMATYLNSFHQT